MKLLAFILSIYILTLNLVPCEDTLSYDNEVKTEISQDVSDNHQHQDSDLCSPFCNCHCCHINTIHFDIVDFTMVNTVVATKLFYHFNGLEKDFNPTILQPPRV